MKSPPELLYYLNATATAPGGELMGIALLDHLIFNRTGYLSFLEAGIQF